MSHDYDIIGFLQQAFELGQMASFLFVDIKTVTRHLSALDLKLRTLGQDLVSVTASVVSLGEHLLCLDLSVLIYQIRGLKLSFHSTLISVI